jgi:hypothetical protein
LVANEGEPSDDYRIDPEGSVSIVDLPEDIRLLGQAHVRTASFRKFNDAALAPSIRIFGPNASVAQDLEPEYITVSRDSRTAWVALQENNAVAVLDIGAGEFTALHGLGFKDHLLPGNELDVSDRDDRINSARGRSRSGPPISSGSTTAARSSNGSPPSASRTTSTPTIARTPSTTAATTRDRSRRAWRWPVCGAASTPSSGWSASAG